LTAYVDAIQAAAFLRFRSPSGVRNAVMRGELTPVGRGSRQCLLFTMEELERFVRDRARKYGRPRLEIAVETAVAQTSSAATVGADPKKRVDIASKRAPGRQESSPLGFREIVARVKDRRDRDVTGDPELRTRGRGGNR
jgi:hypothetical protein